MPRRTHSTVDKLPADLRSTLMRMITDGYWPEEYGDGKEGKPTYDDCVEYVTLAGYSISRTAFARWAKRLNAMELMRTRAEIVRNVMAEGDSPEDFADNQRATADLINARILEAAMKGELKPKETRELAAAAKDCMRMRIDNDQYRQKVRTRIKETTEQIGKVISDAEIRKQVQKIIDERLGIL